MYRQIPALPATYNQVDAWLYVEQNPVTEAGTIKLISNGDLIAEATDVEVPARDEDAIAAFADLLAGGETSASKADARAWAERLAAPAS